MSASNMIRKQCHLSAKVEECTCKVDFRAYKGKKAVVIYLGTNNITTDSSPKTIVIIISGIISRSGIRVVFKITDTY